jgi:hypothetical protein
MTCTIAAIAAALAGAMLGAAAMAMLAAKADGLDLDDPQGRRQLDDWLRRTR